MNDDQFSRLSEQLGRLIMMFEMFLNADGISFDESDLVRRTARQSIIDDPRPPVHWTKEFRPYRPDEPLPDPDATPFAVQGNSEDSDQWQSILAAWKKKHGCIQPRVRR